ncbi:MAG: hypothetical protein ACTSVI_10060 [Promethearchaeota archaeon]
MSEYFSALSIPLVIINCLFVILIIWHLINSKETQSIKDGILLVISYSVSVILTPFILKGTSATDQGEDLLFIIGSLFFAFILLIMLVIIVRNYYIYKKNPEAKKERNYQLFMNALEKRNEKSLDNSRKILHVVISIAPIIVYWIVFSMDNYFKAQGVMQEFGVTGLAAGRGVNLLIFWGFSYMGTLGDICRLNGFHLLPFWGRKWYETSLRSKEFHTFTAAIPFLLGHIPLLMMPFPVFFTTSFVAALADAGTSIIGIRFGKHPISSKTKKTWEGLIAGLIISLICSMIVNIYFNSGPVITIIIYSLLVALFFGLSDALNNYLDDNFVNTFILGMINLLFYQLIF